MAIEQWSENIWLIQLDNEPALSEDLIQLKDKVRRADETPFLVIDFGSVTHINSSNLSQLLRVRKEVVARDGKIKITGLSDSIWAVFLTTALDKIFDFAADLPTALAGLQIGE
jgi:anti-anti-sigma factor